MDWLFGYNEDKMKPYLKMATQRINIAVNKKTTQIKHTKREIAQLLAENKDEKARIRTEHVIREDFMIESYEIIELLCELCHERVRYISSSKECPDDLVQAISSLIWCSNRVEIDELQEVKKQLTKKFGSKFAKAAEDNTGGVVNERLFGKLMVAPPSAMLVNGYLEEIAKEYNVDWAPVSLGMPETGPVTSPAGFSVPMAPGSELRSAYQRDPGQAPGNYEPEPTIYPAVAIPSHPVASPSGKGAPYTDAAPLYTPPANTQPYMQPGVYVNPEPTTAHGQLGPDVAPAKAGYADYDIPAAPSYAPMQGDVGEGKSGGTPSGGDEKGDNASFDALAARFAALQNKD